MPLAVVAGSPSHRHLLEPGAACELELGHAGAHRCGLLSWHDPPLLVGRPATRGAALVFSWEREAPR